MGEHKIAENYFGLKYLCGFLAHLRQISQGALIIPPANCLLCGGGGVGYTVFTLSVPVCPPVRHVLLFLYYLEKAVMEIHQILQTH